MAKVPFTEPTYPTDNNQNQPDEPTISAEEFKLLLDQVGIDTKSFLENLLVELASSVLGQSGALRIGSNVPNVSGDNVGDNLIDLKQQIDDATTGILPDGSVTAAKLAASSVENEKIASNAVTFDKITFSGALVYNSGNQTIAPGTPIAFDSEVYDTNGIHDTVTNNSRLTVPSGVTKVRLKGLVKQTGTDLDFGAYMHKDGTNEIGLPQDRRAITSASGGVSAISLCSAVLEVTSGEYFELKHFTGDASDTISAETWFSMEIVE